MVDIELLKKNVTNYEACIDEFLRDIRDRVEDYSYFKEEREDIRKEVYADVIYLLTYLRIIEFDSTNCDSERDIELVVKFLKEMQEDKE